MELFTLSKPESTPKSIVRQISPEKREWARKESQAILAKNLMTREKTKQDMFEKRLQHDKMQQEINLVAEDERISEENSIRIKEEEERRRKMEARKDKAKNEIIMKALSEFSDLEALRREKRAIMEEEQRLKALLSLEKVTVTGKADRIVAERAQKQRKEAKLAHRRNIYRDSLDQIIDEERIALMKKHAVLQQQQSSLHNNSVCNLNSAAASTSRTHNSNAGMINNSGSAILTPAAIAAMTATSNY